jgi:hypothetical protein
MGFLGTGEIKAMAALINSQANATVTALAGPGEVSDSGDADDYTPAWAGQAPALLDTASEAIEVRSGGSGVTVELADQTNTITLTILDGVAPIVAQAGHSWDGWQVTVLDRRVAPAVSRTLVIDRMVREAYGLLDSITLKLKA